MYKIGDKVLCKKNNYGCSWFIRVRKNIEKYELIKKTDKYHTF